MNQTDEERFAAGIDWKISPVSPAHLRFTELDGTRDFSVNYLAEAGFHQVKRMVAACGKVHSLSGPQS